MVVTSPLKPHDFTMCIPLHRRENLSLDKEKPHGFSWRSYGAGH